MGNPTGVGTTLANPSPVTRCKPWCINHNAAEGVCEGPIEAHPGSEFSDPGTIRLSYTPDDGTFIDFADNYLPLPQAKRFALALLRQIERASADESLLVGVGR